MARDDRVGLFVGAAGFQEQQRQRRAIDVEPRTDTVKAARTIVAGFAGGSSAVANVGVETSIERCERTLVAGTTSQRGWLTQTYTLDNPGDIRRPARRTGALNLFSGGPMPAVGHGIKMRRRYLYSIR